MKVVFLFHGGIAPQAEAEKTFKPFARTGNFSRKASSKAGFLCAKW